MTESSFVPKDYTIPSSGGGDFMKLQGGDNKFRVLSELAMGYEGWTKDKKCIRKRMEEKWDDTMPILQERDGKTVEPKHFWAMLVWNYADEAVQLLTVTQVTIMKALEALATDDEWGNPRGYDIKVVKTGTTWEDTEYVVNPVPPRPADEKILTAYVAYEKTIEDVYTEPRAAGKDSGEKEVDHTVFDS